MFLWIKAKAKVLLKFYFDDSVICIHHSTPQHCPTLYVILTAFAYSNNMQSRVTNDLDSISVLENKSLGDVISL